MFLAVKTDLAPPDEWTPPLNKSIIKYQSRRRLYPDPYVPRFTMTFSHIIAWHESPSWYTRYTLMSESNIHAFLIDTRSLRILSINFCHSLWLSGQYKSTPYLHLTESITTPLRNHDLIRAHSTCGLWNPHQLNWHISRGERSSQYPPRYSGQYPEVDNH